MDAVSTILVSYQCPLSPHWHKVLPHPSPDGAPVPTVSVGRFLLEKPPEEALDALFFAFLVNLLDLGVKRRPPGVCVAAKVRLPAGSVAEARTQG